MRGAPDGIDLPFHLAAAFAIAELRWGPRLPIEHGLRDTQAELRWQAEPGPAATRFMPMHITRLTAADAPQYRELMLEAYVEAADAFTSTAGERLAQPMSWWIDRIAAPSGQGRSFGAYDGQQLVGTVALEFSTKPKTSHSALVIGMYVKPAGRRLGAGRGLMQALVAEAWSRPELHVLRLTVTEGNAAAIRLYESVGFAAWGVEPQAIRTPSGYKGKVHMWMPLAGADTAA